MARDSIINRWDINGDVYEIQDAGRGRPLGVATLDENGRVPYTQLPESAVEFKGYWDASTNTPELSDGTGTKGDMYYVDVAGTQDLGSGSQTFRVGDRVLYDGNVWKNMNPPTDFQQIFNLMHPIDEVYVQFPTEKSPTELYNINGIVSVWTDITANYNGAFFRAYKNGTSGNFFDYNDTLGTPQASQNKSHSHNSGWTGGPVTNNNDHTPSTSTGGMSNHSSGSMAPVGFTVGDAGASRSPANTTNPISSISSGRGVWQASGTSKSVVEGYTVSFDLSHTHSFNHVHSISNEGGIEARPDNYAIKIWKRTS